MPPLRVHPEKFPFAAPGAPRPMPRLDEAARPGTREFKILQSRQSPAQMTLSLRRST